MIANVKNSRPLFDVEPSHINIAVYNNSHSDIEINFWSGFGKRFHFYGPFLIGRSRVDTHNGRLLPSKTTIFWRKLGSNNEQHQDVDLSDVPVDLKSGIIVFELDKNGHWIVSWEKY